MWDDDETYSDFARSQDDFEDTDPVQAKTKATAKPVDLANQPANKQNNEFNWDYSTTQKDQGNTDTKAA